ncbi:MAG: hypothetical protein K2K01_05615, partial [Eubacterium sp.]|nr:hypothetical protein [Eubacterium sp.]
PEPPDPTDPTEPTEPTDPTDPTDPTEPTEPTKLVAPKAKLTVNDNGSLTITWDEVEGADLYEVYILNNSTGKYQLSKTTDKTSLNTANTVQYGVKYSYKVKAIDSEGKMIASNFSNVVTGTNKKMLQTPTLSVKVNSSGTFTLSWKAIAGVESYQLCQRNSDGTFKLLKTTSSTSYTTSLQAYNTECAYKVRAITNKNVDATSAFSNIVTAKNTKKLQTPTLKVAVNSNGTFKFSWGKITGADKYQIYVKNSDGSYKLFKTVTGTSYTSTYKTYNKQYTYKVRAVNNKKSSATSAYSKTVTAKNTKKLAAPSGVKLSVNKNGSFTIKWNKVTGADKYQVYVLNSKTNKYTLLKTTTSNKVTTGVATKGVTYKYKVRAVKNSNSSATSAYSSVVSKKR